MCWTALKRLGSGPWVLMAEEHMYNPLFLANKIHSRFSYSQNPNQIEPKCILIANSFTWTFEMFYSIIHICPSVHNSAENYVVITDLLSSALVFFIHLGGFSLLCFLHFIIITNLCTWAIVRMWLIIDGFHNQRESFLCRDKHLYGLDP